jgi:AbrB family looped-hinge helix DNA binding protein
MVWYNGIMNATITVDKAGRIVLPKPVRDELQLQAGDSLELEISGEEITLRPIRPKIHLRREDGLWVYSVGEPLSAKAVEQTIEAIRRERDEQNFGKVK